MVVWWADTTEPPGSAACELADVIPDTVVYDGDDLAEYVIDANSSRRHMSTGARAMATAVPFVIG